VSVGSFRVREDLLLVSLFGECQGEVGSVIKVVIVIMTSDGDPTGVTRRLSTGEIFFCSGLLSTRIVSSVEQGTSSHCSVE